MTTIELNDETAEALAEIAKAQSTSIEKLIQLHVLGKIELPESAGSQEDDFDTKLEELLSDGPILPKDFSRADIYTDE